LEKCEEIIFVDKRKKQKLKNDVSMQVSGLKVSAIKILRVIVLTNGI